MIQEKMRDAPQDSPETSSPVPKRNQGEWSEAFVLFKLICDGGIPLGNGNLGTLGDRVPVSVKKVMIPNSDSSLSLSGNDNLEVVDKNGATRSSCQFDEILLQEKLIGIKDKLPKHKSAFAFPDFDRLADELGIVVPKKARSSHKSDIVLDIEYDGVSYPEQGFSVKSFLGKPPTLLNAAPRSTNFIFEVVNLSGSHLGKVNEIEGERKEGEGKVQRRVQYIYKHGGELVFLKTLKPSIDHNLRKVGVPPEFFARMMLEKYRAEKSMVKISEILEWMHKNRWFGLDIDDDLTSIQEKLKDLLLASLLGMVPGTKWDGQYSADGAIVVTKEGELLAFHRSFEPKHLRDYLFASVAFDTPGTTKHKHGEIYWDVEERMCFNLNFQLRLKPH